MSINRINDPVLGALVLSRRKGSKHIRLSVNSRGEVMVNIPPRMPLIIGIKFARSKKAWINKQKLKTSNYELTDGMIIGKHYRLRLLRDIHKSKTYSSLKSDTLVIYNYDNNDEDSVRIANTAITRCLRKQAEELLLPRLKIISKTYGYDYRSSKIKLLRSRWGSCSSKKEISLSLFLIQLPWELIDYVLLHELAHTKQMNHSAKFWQLVKDDMPDYEDRRKMLKSYRPTIIT